MMRWLDAIGTLWLVFLAALGFWQVLGWLVRQIDKLPWKAENPTEK